MEARAPGTGLVFYALLLQYRDHFARVLGIHAAVEQREIRAAGEKHHHHQRADDQHAGGGHGDFLVQAQLLPDGQQLRG